MKKSKTKLKYIELPFRQFAKLFPEKAKQVPGLKMLLQDPSYIVRFRDGVIEIGYIEDLWQIS